MERYIFDFTSHAKLNVHPVQVCFMITIVLAILNRFETSLLHDAVSFLIMIETRVTNDAFLGVL